ncbi:MAG: hypothetical protein RTU30_14920 [Candidatus Thorarchaeota archaeon]
MEEESFEGIVQDEESTNEQQESLEDVQEDKDSTVKRPGLNEIFFLFLFGTIVTLLAIYVSLYNMEQWNVCGFAFDDSWIHVQFARTLFEGRPWEYAAGVPSTGDSAPLWPIILTPIFLLGYDISTIVTSVMFIGGVIYIINTFLIGLIIRQHTGHWQVGLIGQVIFVLLPRNTGMMLSGMEMPIAIMTLFLALLILPREDRKYDPILGVVVGLAYLSRPEFFLIAALCLPVRSLWMLYKDDKKKQRLLSLIAMFGIAALTVAPWVLFCLSATGLPLPDSYYLKLGWSIGEAAWGKWSWWWARWLAVEMQFIYVAILSIPFMLRRGKVYEPILAIAFAILNYVTMPGRSLLFDARYLVPLFNILAIMFIVGCSFIVESVMGIEREFRWRSKLSRFKISSRTITIVIIGLLFLTTIPWYIKHENTHANQIKNISEMQVTCALWAVENLPEDSVILVYDVGAIGYLAHGKVIDWIGLTYSPMQHIYTNRSLRVQYLKEQGCKYIIYYDPWINGVSRAFLSANATLQELFRTHLTDNVVCGTTDMVIYEILWDSL